MLALRFDVFREDMTKFRHIIELVREADKIAGQMGWSGTWAVARGDDPMPDLLRNDHQTV